MNILFLIRGGQTRPARCSEWSVLFEFIKIHNFESIMNQLTIEGRIVHDFLDYCWNEATVDRKWVHIDSTLEYPISLNHPYYYEQNWGKSMSTSWHFLRCRVDNALM
jgi:peptide-N4-(N-acetyl-beta-glucosaminyl)asparagine amidase